MATHHSDPPAPDEVEVSLFGPGYGEAVVLHVGGGQWILVDSCVEPLTGRPAALSYLRGLGVDVRNAVRLVVATHWHDDHVHGLGTVVRECGFASICVSSALRAKDFLTLARLYDEPVARRTSGLSEFIEVLETLEARQGRSVRFAPPQFAVVDRLLFHDQIQTGSGTTEVEVFALSPSDASLQQAYVAFAQLLGEAEPIRRVASPTPNCASVVLWVRVGPERILLGADLERTADQRTGWSAVLNESQVVSGRAGVFKIPHHGAESAHHDQVWTDLLLDDPHAVLTPFRRGGQSLPTREDVSRISGATSQAYATSPPRRRRQRWQNRVVRDFVSQVTRDIGDVHCGWGHIRLRKRIDETAQSWRADLAGDAYRLSSS